MCEVPSSAFVNRSAVPVPSARCQKMPRSPSRSDWNATRWLSADQTGNRLCPCPSNVTRRIELVPASSCDERQPVSSGLDNVASEEDHWTAGWRHSHIPEDREPHD